MKNKELDQILLNYNNQLLHYDAKKKVLEKMIEDLDAQYKEAGDKWDFFWKERQIFINSNKKELEASE